MPAKSKYVIGRQIGKYLKYTLFTTNILAVILLALSVSAWIIVPSKTTIVAYLGLAFPLILALNIAFLVVWIIFFRWAYVLVQLVVLLFCWTPISTYFPMHSKTKQVPEKSIKILSYNVRGFNWLTGKKAKKNPIFDYILSTDADIVCLQEVAIYPTKNRYNIISEGELNNIMKKYPYHSIVRLGNSNSKHIYGIACYSKYPILKTIPIPIESTFNGSAMFEIKVDYNTINLINNHLESNRITAEDKKLYKDFFNSKTKDKDAISEVTSNIQDRLGVAFKTREKQVNSIRKFLEKQELRPTIICGDFNDTPISYAYYTMKGNLIDSYANTGFGQGITYHENKFWFRIDYIFHSAHFQSYNCTVDKVKYSDHYPIWTYLKLK